MAESPTNNPIDQADLLLNEYLRGEKLPAFRSDRIVLGSLLGIGMLINMGAAIIGLDAIETVSLALSAIVCPISIAIPILIAFVVAETTSRVTETVAHAPSLQVVPCSNRRILRTLLRGAYIQIGSVIWFMGVLASLMALNLSLQPSFWDRLAGSYGTYDPAHVYTTTETTANAGFWWVMHLGVVSVCFVGVSIGIWMGLLSRSILARILIIPVMLFIIIALLVIFLGGGAAIDGDLAQWPDAVLVPSLFCVLPVMGISLAFLLGVQYTIGQLRASD